MGRKSQVRWERVQKVLRQLRKRPGWNFRDLVDAREEGQCEHSMASVVWALELGMLSNQPTLRDVEQLTEECQGNARVLVPKRISDTTMATELCRLDEAGLTARLCKQIREYGRQKQLKPFGVPVGIATIDGKNLATLDHHALGSGHKRSSQTEKWAKEADVTGKPYWLMPALRVTLSSAEVVPCIYQEPLLPGEGEETAAPRLIDALHQAYGRSAMIDVLDFDAGFTSLALANHVNDLGYAYIFGLKDNQPSLYAQAQETLNRQSLREAPEAKTDWELRNGRKIRRLLYRSNDLLGFETTPGRWNHLRQVWWVKQETEHPDGRIEVENRYFLSSLLWNRFSPEQILWAVRRHWAVENDTFNSLDQQWREDHAPWCTQGRSIWVLGLLRLMAYNVVQSLRKRRLRQRRDTGKRDVPPPWRSVFQWMYQALTRDATRLAPMASVNR